MKKSAKARIIGLGAYLPKRVMTNQDFEQMVETSDEWIVTRTGIRERRIAAADEFTSDMATAAAKAALARAKVQAADIDLIIVATMTPDRISSSVAAIVQTQIGAEKAAAFDLQAACTGFLYGISCAKAFIESGMYRHILVIGAEKMSSFVDYSDRSTSVLFGDGAAAAILTNEGDGLAIDSICLGADGSLAELLQIPAGGSRCPASAETIQNKLHYFKMDGKEVFKHAVRRMSNATKECLAEMGISDENLSWLVPHQANLRIMDAIAKGFKLAPERMYKTVHKYGNTSASSVVIALEELIQEHTLVEGEHVMLVAFGAGLTWGAAILTKVLK